MTDAASPSAPETVLLTGFPGFLARRLVREVAARGGRRRWVFLVEKRFSERAAEDLRVLQRTEPLLEGSWELVPGDVTDPQLGFGDETYADLAGRVDEVWHFAAVYDLAVREEIAERVNVAGTRHVLDFCEACSVLQRLCYVSTCYVSGDRTGVIRESELEEGQSFKNFYESTKFRAEVEVQRRRKSIPTVIFRPAVVVGDSRSGETDKYDGPYYMIRLGMRMPRYLPMVNIGRGRSVVNIVPVDFVIRAMVEIASQPGSAGKVFHLADPDAIPTAEGIALIFERLGKMRPIGRVPPALVDLALRARAVRDLLGVPREMVHYMNLDTRYDVVNTLDALDGTGIECPHLSTYLDTLIGYVQAHPEKEFLVRHER